MAKKPSKNIDPVIKRLDTLIILLQDIFILEGARLGIRKEDLRKILALDRRRISRISKHVETEQD